MAFAGVTMAFAGVAMAFAGATMAFARAHWVPAFAGMTNVSEYAVGSGRRGSTCVGSVCSRHGAGDLQALGVEGVFQGAQA